MKALDVHYDMNANGAVTISDAWLWVKWFFCLPGNLVLELIAKLPKLSIFLELEASYATGYGHFYSWPAWCISAFVWFCAGALLLEAVEGPYRERARKKAVQSTYGR